MRIFKITFALWYDPFWWELRRLSWKKRRYWLARPATSAVGGRAFALQVGPVTLKWSLHGRLE